MLLGAGCSSKICSLRRSWTNQSINTGLLAELLITTTRVRSHFPIDPKNNIGGTNPKFHKQGVAYGKHALKN